MVLSQRARVSRIARTAASFAIGFAVLVMILVASLTGPADALSRIKDIADVEGVRENPLVGYGLVVGLDGTGDSLRNSPFTRQSLTAMLERLGVNTRGETLNTKNVAAVMVTAKLPPFVSQGTTVDVIISAIGDATNLAGGMLLVTPLMAADGEVYAVAQGPVAVGGFSAQGQAGSVKQGVPTSGRIANGAVVEREIPYTLAAERSLRLLLKNPDLTTARRVAEAVNTFLNAPAAVPTDPSTVALALPSGYPGNIVSLLTDIEQLRVDPDLAARVIIDEQSGIIVMGQQVRVNTIAIAQGNLTISVTETPQVSQPSPLSNAGTTQVVPRTEIGVDDGSDRRIAVLQTGVTLQELVDGLNALGVGPRDLISILQAIKASGALQAELEVM